MSSIEKLRQKRLQRQGQAADVEALLHPTEGSEGPPNGSDQRLDASRARVEKPSELPPFTPESCPSSPEELRQCILRFLASGGCSCPVSAVGLNAALRREHLRAGHPRSALSVFRASDTVAALLVIRQSLQDLNDPGALVLDGDGEDLLIVDAEPARIASLLHSLGAGESRAKRARLEVSSMPPVQDFHLGSAMLTRMPSAQGNGHESVSVEDLLQAPTARQRQLIDAGDELRQLLAEPTARQSLTAQKFMNKTQNMAQFCPHGSRSDCRAATGFMSACAKIHFRKVIKPWTDESLGDCSYLDTCRHIEKCKYVHYALDLTVEQTRYLQERGVHNRGTDTKRINELVMKGMNLPAQWIHCDLRSFPLSIFKGLISVVMADPPWDIHMELPYGTLTDEEVKNLNIGDIHEHGMIFLWVTGRAMELARECFRLWGYKRIEEIVWVKTNQLQRIIRTGRTGHWINHAKEHCLVGIKGNPKLNRNLDCDVIVSEVRETSRKPDEIYNLIERMFPNCQKLELFGRPHNVHENWITCGNQLDGVRLVDEEIVKRYNEEFPQTPTTPWRRAKDELIAYGGDDAPWVPPSEAPKQPPPSTSEAWVPPPPQAGWHAPPAAHAAHASMSWGWPLMR
ncbi:Probable N6-adenosine-methyltransferase MT-A70-like [Durusdinium trenchii]|uniref:mRNA m(6)A methyltransferase n=1 Tax=Durusdinium trenchii TaxID=1381693 RepID=A0ABP0JQR8_9DINO